MWRTALWGLIVLAGEAEARASATAPLTSIATAEGPPAASGPLAQELPDRSNPDYVYCEDFEEGRARDNSLPVFSIAKRHGVREGAGYKSRYGFSNVLIEDHGLPPYPRVRFPRHQGVLFAHFHLRSPENFYLGRANHGYYLYDSANERAGRSVLDHATDHPAWLDPEWDPHTVVITRGSGYDVKRSFEGFAPRHRGQWHSHQLMIVPSQKDPTVGRMKVWMDGELSNCTKQATIPAFDTFWITNYWHSLAYVPQDSGYGNLFEAHTAPPHPAFEILLDNLVISKSFIEFGPNRFQIERVRFADLKPGGFSVHFDTTVAAKTISAQWDSPQEPGRFVKANASPSDYVHSLKVDGLKPGATYRLRLAAADIRGREAQSEPIMFRSAPTGLYPEFEFPDWKGEVYQNLDFQDTPVYVRNFKDLSFVSWPGGDSDDLVDTSRPMCVRYTRRQRFTAGTYVFRVHAYDGIRVTVDGDVKVDAVHRTQGHNRRRDFRLPLAAGEHAIIVEHTIWRADDWERGYSKELAFKICPNDTEAPVCYAQRIYNSQFWKPDEPMYCGRWSEECQVTIEYGETTRYGGKAEGWGRYPSVRLGKLEIGKTYHYRVTAVDLMGNRAFCPDATFTVGDTIPPCKILMSLERLSDTQIRLTFKAPGEDSNFGTAAEYDLRWSDGPLAISTWNQATRVKDVVKPSRAHTAETITLDGFPRGKSYQFAVRAIDDHGNVGLLSNVVSDPPGPEVMDCDGDGFGVGSLKGPDPDDYDRHVPDPAAK